MNLEAVALAFFLTSLVKVRRWSFGESESTQMFGKVFLS